MLDHTIASILKLLLSSTLTLIGPLGLWHSIRCTMLISQNGIDIRFVALVRFIKCD